MDKHRRIVITGIGVISSLGNDLASFSRHYLQGKLPEIQERTVVFLETAYLQKIMALPSWEDKSVPSAHRRRMSLLSRMIAVTAMQCLENANLEKEKWAQLGLVIGTGWGEQETVHKVIPQVILEESEMVPFPTLFHNSVHNASAGYLGMILQSQGPAITVSQEEHSFEAALENGMLLMDRGHSRAVLAGGADEFFDFAVLEERKSPFPADTISSGSCFFMLETEEDARERKARIYARCSFLPPGKLDESTIEEYSEEVKSSLAGGKSPDLALFTGPIDDRTEMLARSFLARIFPTPVPEIFYGSYPSRPTQGAERFLESLVMLESQSVPLQLKKDAGIDHPSGILLVCLTGSRQCRLFYLQQGEQ